jgi:hypothetical protein
MYISQWLNLRVSCSQILEGEISPKQGQDKEGALAGPLWAASHRRLKKQN